MDDFPTINPKIAFLTGFAASLTLFKRLALLDLILVEWISVLLTLLHHVMLLTAWFESICFFVFDLM